MEKRLMRFCTSKSNLPVYPLQGRAQEFERGGGAQFEAVSFLPKVK